MAPTLTASSTEVLAGLVDRVTFHNSDNGLCVLRVKARGQRDLITLVGHAAMISVGESVQASGSWISDRTHGVQFKASFLKAAAPTTVPPAAEATSDTDPAQPLSHPCPCCGGRMIIIEIFKRGSTPRTRPPSPIRIDTS